jgi:hypothetical protein
MPSRGVDFERHAAGLKGQGGLFDFFAHIRLGTMAEFLHQIAVGDNIEQARFRRAAQEAIIIPVDRGDILLFPKIHRARIVEFPLVDHVDRAKHVVPFVALGQCPGIVFPPLQVIRFDAQPDGDFGIAFAQFQYGLHVLGQVFLGHGQLGVPLGHQRKMIREPDFGQSSLDRRFHVFVHFSPGMAAPGSVDMIVSRLVHSVEQVPPEIGLSLFRDEMRSACYRLRIVWRIRAGLLLRQLALQPRDFRHRPVGFPG